MSPLLPLSLAAAAAAPPPGNQARYGLHRFGECIVKANPAGARALVVLDVRTPQYNAKLSEVVSGHKRCLKKAAGLSTSTVNLGGVIAEALLSVRFQPNIPAERLAPDPRRAAVPVRGPAETLALCTVLSAPERTAGLFATEPGSVRETSAIEALRPTMRSCLKREVPVSGDNAVMRSALALAAWRLVSAPRKAQ